VLRLRRFLLRTTSRTERIDMYSLRRGFKHRGLVGGSSDVRRVVVGFRMSDDVLSDAR